MTYRAAEGADILNLYRGCRRFARRLETLQDYDLTGSEGRFRAFLADEPLPPPSAGKRAELDLIARLQADGRYVGRVHVISQPLTDYIRYELAVYAENTAAGENVFIADMSAHPELAGLVQDFAVFDAETVAFFDYDSDGRVRGYRIADDNATVARCIREYALAASWAVPLAEFQAAAAA